MSLIEQAAKRLAELNRAGATVREPSDATEMEQAAYARRDHVPTPEAIVREFNSRNLESELVPASRITRSEVEIGPSARTDWGNSVPRNKVDLDLARLAVRGLVTPENKDSQIAHEFRVLKRPIVRNAGGRAGTATIRHGNLVMVTSALPGEGKTFTAANLALSLAMEVDTTVLLVDGDVARPSLPEFFGIPHSPGLMDLLTRDDLDLSQVLLSTNVEGLTLLPAGTRQSHATELLSSEKMAALLRELASRNAKRIVIFDSPPLVATAEAPALAAQMGQIVMVIAADTTPRKTVSHALTTIERCEIVLMVLNKTTKSDVGLNYGYYSTDDPR
jgi:protein-tyrosine kinase